MDLQQLIQMFQSRQAKPGGVSAPNAIATMGMRQKYNRYVEQANSMGQEALPFEQWMMKARQPNAGY